MSLRAAIDKLLQGRNPRERQILIWGSAAAGLLILVMGCLLPLQQAQSRLERSVAVEGRRLAAMNAVKLELDSIKKQTGQASRPALTRPAVEELTRSRLAPAMLDVRMEGEQAVRVVFSGAPMSRVVEWADELSRTQRVHVSFARLRAEGGTITGEIKFSGPEQ